jgi:hypothetical protein
VQSVLSRQEALAGLPARRARAILSLIENLAGQLAADDRLPAELSMALEEGRVDDAFFKAHGLARQSIKPTTIQDLEVYAARWQALVPDNPRVQAALVHGLAARYQFTAAAIPLTRAALGMDLSPVREAYQALYGGPLEGVYVHRVGLAESLRWAAAAPTKWLESLPPFWMAVVMTLALSLSQAVLALPIAVAGLGPLPAVGLIAAVGVLNVVSLAQLAESFSRHGTIVQRNVFLGRVITDYLGSTGSTILTSATALRMAAGLLASFIGLGFTLGEITPVPPAIWALVLFLLAPYLLAGQRLSFSTSLSVMFGLICVALVLCLSLLSLSGFALANLASSPVFAGQPLSITAGAAVGVVVQGYIAQSYLIQSAKLVLPRDPSGRSLVLGSIVAMVLMVALLCFWVLAVNSALPAEVLMGQSGTVLAPLAERSGPLFAVLGSPLVILLLGLASLRQSTVLAGLANERLPDRLQNRVRFWASMSPIAAIFLMTEALLLSGHASFAGVMAIGGLLCNSLVVGIFPPLLIVACRRKSDLVPGIVLRWLANPLIVAGVYLGFIGILLLHAVFIWSGPGERLAALAVAAVALAGTFAMVRGGAFTPRTVVGIRPSVGDLFPLLQITDCGASVPIRFTLTYVNEPMRVVEATAVALAECDKLQTVRCELPPSAGRELKLWTWAPATNDPGPGGLSSATLEDADGRSTELHPGIASIVPRSGRAAILTLEFGPASEPAPRR